MIVAVLVLLFLVGYGAWVPFRQAAEIEKFTRESPAPVPALTLAPSDPAAAELNERLKSFNESLAKPEGEARISLDAADLNRSIALFDALKELRGTFHVTAITAEAIEADICYTLNGRPRLAREGESGPITADPRYLVGKVRLTPLLGKRELAFRVESLEVPGATVPDGFMGHFSTLRLFERWLQDPVIGGAMARLTRADLADGRLVLARIPGEPVPDTVSDEQFKAGGGKVVMFIGGAMLCFLLFAGTLLFLGYRRQLRKIVAAEQAESGESDSDRRI